MTLFLGAFFFPVTVANFLVPVFSLGASAKTSSDFCVSNMTLANYVLDFVWKKKMEKRLLGH